MKWLDEEVNMVCKKCNNGAVYNEVLGKGYYYCRQCKVEVELVLVYNEFDEWSINHNWTEFDIQKQLDAIADLNKSVDPIVKMYYSAFPDSNEDK